ncbi:hypothetical protein HPB49_019086 [Dermacentor silvarum]|uniref:Uncharacterized protein n=1 Tax=Dermacentor silvarum TaxID=543639 RepID=A0ACB8DQW1_DERSI|nr:hypothetical protein HPB49_019086 [Dermacentor silvarum]
MSTLECCTVRVRLGGIDTAVASMYIQPCQSKDHTCLLQLARRLGRDFVLLPRRQCSLHHLGPSPLLRARISVVVLVNRLGLKILGTRAPTFVRRTTRAGSMAIDMLRNLQEADQRRLLEHFNTIWSTGVIVDSWLTVVVAKILKPRKPEAAPYRHRPLSLASSTWQEPDVHPDDGKYSEYYTKFAGKGRYVVKAGVKGNEARKACCASCSGSAFMPRRLLTLPSGHCEPGSEFDISCFPTSNETFKPAPPPQGEPIDPFQLEIDLGSFEVTDDLHEHMVPPVAVRDLSVFKARPGKNGTLLANMTWTWPGKHMTHGTGWYWL